MPDQVHRLHVAPEPPIAASDHCPSAGTAQSADAEAPTGDDDEKPAEDEPVVLRRARGPYNSHYEATDRGIRLVSGDHELVLSNFDAEVTRRVRRGKQTILHLRVQFGDFVRRLEMTPAKLERMSWVSEEIPGGVVWPGPAVRAHLLAAISLLSMPEEAEAHDHLGWVRRRGRWAYVHAGGLVDADGHHDALVEVGAPVDKFILPDRPGRPDAILDLIGLAPDTFMVPQVASIARAALGNNVRFGIHTMGTTGGGKSATAGIIQSFWGSEMSDADRLPCSWQSTSAALEVACHRTADTLMVIDDFVDGVCGDEQSYDAILRAAANGSGRARYTRAAAPPRCLVLSTGEHRLRFPSLVARVITLALGPGELDWVKLTELQARARSGDFSAWMTGFLRWCAPRLDGLRDQLRRHAHDLRRRFGSFQVHPRTVDALAELGASVLILVQYLTDSDALDHDGARTFVQRSQAALDGVAAQQARLQLHGDPARLFMTVMADLLERHQVAITEDTTACPGEGEPPVIGWIRGREVLLDPASAMSAVQDVLGRDQGLDLSERAMGRALRQAGLLTRVDPRGNAIRFAVRARIGGERRAVWALAADALPQFCGPSGPTGEDGVIDGDGTVGGGGATGATVSEVGPMADPGVALS